MLRSLIAAIVFAATAAAQIWPDTWHGSTRGKVGAAPIDDKMLWLEYGGEASEKAAYSGPVGPFSAAAWRFPDSTSALAWFQALRPENCAALRGAPLNCTTPGTQFIAHQNYVLAFEGWRPLAAELNELYSKLPRLRSGGGLPLLPGYLPDKGRIRNSERYLMGVHSLQKFMPQVPPSIAGFEDGIEAQFARFQAPSGEIPFAIFAFHTPQLAMVREREFARQSGWILKRSGTLIGVVPGGADSRTAQSLLAGLDYKANVIWNEATKPPPLPNVAGMLLAIFELTGLLLVVCIGGGVVFASIRAYLRRRRVLLRGSDEALVFLDLRS